MNHSGQVERVNSLAQAAMPRWQRLLAEAVRDPAELCRLLELPWPDPDISAEAARRFRLLVPRGFVARMEKGNRRDPLLLQVLPISAETADVDGFVVDPLAERDCSPAEGLLHKYHGRALLVVTGACAIHCRYCFRRHFPYDQVERSGDWWLAARDHISGDATIRELILSGGDPLTLPDRTLARLVADFAEVPHLERLRIHSRLPVVLPERIDDGLIAWLTAGRLRPVMVIHANHPREISPEVAAACRRLSSAGVTMLNQSVLLNGVNDDPYILASLSEALFAAGVQPYYLHALDQVQGAAHFAVSDERMQEIARTMQACLPGYLVPRLVREVSGADAKVPLIFAKP